MIELVTKKCSGPLCKGQERALNEFHANRSKKDGLQVWCRACANEATRKYYNTPKGKEIAKAHRNTPEGKEVAKERWLKYSYNLSLEAYNELLKKQGGVCAICGDLPKVGKPLAVDHNHKTKEVGGLLCSSCNISIGFIERAPHLVKLEIQYLQKLNRLPTEFLQNQTRDKDVP
jgi:hypothetical protein